MTEAVSVVAADPGREGAIVRLLFRGGRMHLEYVRLDQLPRDPAGLAHSVRSLIAGWTEDSYLVGASLEEPFAFAGKRGKAQGHMLSYGRSFGHLETALALALDGAVPLTLVHPAQWQPKIIPRRKNVVGSGKARAAFAFDCLFRLPAHIRQHEGVVDAALIALVEAVRIGVLAMPKIPWEHFTTPQGDSDDRNAPDETL